MHAHKAATLGAVAVVAALVAAAPVEAAAAGTSPGGAHGLRELSAAWWQWALSIPDSVNPLTVPETKDGALCGTGQHGNVWFLGGSFNGSVVVRSCRIPSGNRILLPAINGECSVVEDNSLRTPAALRACAKGQMDLVTAATATLDGRALQVVRRQSPLFSITLPTGNVLGISDPTPNPSPAVAEGFWVLVRPLSAGHHVLTAKGTLVVPDPGGFTFTQDVTYNIEIVPPQFGASAMVSQGVIPSGAIPSAVVPTPGE